MMNAKYKGPIVGFTFFCFLLILVELICGHFLGEPNRLQRIRAVLRQDAELFWKQRSNLDVIFEGSAVKTNQEGYRADEFQPHQAKPLRIICLGASPTFGWGVAQHETYSKRLEYYLNKVKSDSSAVEVINAGQIGYSSHQGLKLLKHEIINLKPDILTVAYVINDVDKYRFFRNHGRSDRQLPDKSGLVVNIENVLAHSNFFKFYRSLVEQVQSESMQYFGQRGRQEYVVERRVSAEDYLKNLSEILSIAREHHVRVVFLKMPVNLPQAARVSRVHQDAAEEHITAALKLFDTDQLDSALAKLKEALSFDPYSAEAHYYLGQIYQSQNNKQMARKFFAETVLMELYECQELARMYNQIMQSLAEKQDVEIIDIVAEFAKYEAQGQYLFLDPNHDTIHPNADGHDIIAQAIYSAMMKKSLM